MAFWDNFKKALGGDKSAAQKVVDTLSPWNIGKNIVKAGTERVIKEAKEAGEFYKPIAQPLGKAAGFLGKGAMAPFQALGVQPGAGQGATALKAGAQIGITRGAAKIATETGTDLNNLLKDGMADYAAQTAAEAAVPFDPLLQASNNRWSKSSCKPWCITGCSPYQVLSKSVPRYWYI